MASEGLVRRPGSGMRSPTSGATSPSQPRSRSQSPSPPFTPDPDDDLHPTNSKTYLAHRSTHPSNFTFRALVVGSLIGIIIAFSNTYFGLQTGWISGMVMPSALIGFASFRVLTPLLDASPLTPVENVLVQTVAQSVGTMPLGCGFVGVIPALEFLLNPTEVAAENIGGVNKKGLDLGLSKLLVWALGVCFFGVVFGVPLRKQLVIREKLKFPSGTATALMIGVLHGSEDVDRVDAKGGSLRRRGLRAGDEDESRGLMERERDRDEADEGQDKGAKARDWRHKIKLMTVAFSGSAFYVRSATLSIRLAGTNIADRTHVLCPTTAQPSHSRHASCQNMGLDAKSQSSICWAGYNHGPLDLSTHAPRCRAWLGRAVPTRQITTMGAWSCRRLGDRLQGLDPLGQPRHHVGRCNH